MSHEPDTGWPHLAGRLSGGLHVLALRIYYEDTDFSGVVYHAGYLRFMERGRSDFLRLVGVHHAALHAGGADASRHFAVARMHIDFLKPARIDDIIEVHTRLESFGAASMMVAQQVRRGGDVLASASVRAALLDGTGRPRRLPTSMRTRFQALVEAGREAPFTGG